MLAIADGRPETLNLKGILRNFLEFQYQNTERKYNVLLEKELEKLERSVRKINGVCSVQPVYALQEII